jgi:hypothetical protein
VSAFLIGRCRRVSRAAAATPATPSATRRVVPWRRWFLLEERETLTVCAPRQLALARLVAAAAATASRCRRIGRGLCVVLHAQADRTIDQLGHHPAVCRIPDLFDRSEAADRNVVRTASPCE